MSIVKKNNTKNIRATVAKVNTPYLNRPVSTTCTPGANCAAVFGDHAKPPLQQRAQSIKSEPAIS